MNIMLSINEKNKTPNFNIYGYKPFVKYYLFD